MTKTKQRGFTIIEVALVLAVAALIFLVVFLAVPALQRNQRDDARKRDVSNVVQAVVNDTANTNTVVQAGTAYPKDTAASTLKDYLDNMSGNVDYVLVFDAVASSSGITLPYSFTSNPVNPTATSDNASSVQAYINKIVIYTGVRCNGNTGIQVGTSRSAAVVVQVENGGDGKYYCQDAN